jgi:hypothetical protein
VVFFYISGIIRKSCIFAHNFFALTNGAGMADIAEQVEILTIEVSQYKGECKLACDSDEVLRSSAAKNYVIQQAQAKGLSRAGLSGEPDVYPVTPDGTVIDPMQRGDGRTQQFHAVYKFAGGI